MWKLAWNSMRYYRSQTFAILASIILTAGLLSGISSLLYSSRQSDLQNSKTIYGEWHYRIPVDEALFREIKSSENGNGYDLEQCGKVEYRDAVEEPFHISFLYADETYRTMAHRELAEGEYPKKENEIASDRYTLSNLHFSGRIGDSVTIGEKEYIVTGIVQSEWAANAEDMQVFVGEQFAGTGKWDEIYLKFREEQKLYQQLDAFLEEYNLSGEAAEANDEVVSYLHGEKPEGIYNIVKFALTDKNGNFTYIILKLQEEYNLAFYGMLLLLCLFSLFVIYSIFNISVSKRISQYGIMQTLGIDEKSILGSMMAELWMLFLPGYPAGCLLSNGILKIFYGKLDNVFGNYVLKSPGTGTKISGADQIAAAGHEASYHISWTAVVTGFVFLMASMLYIAYMTVRSMRRQTLRQVMSESGEIGITGRRIYSLRHSNMSDVLVKKFMFAKKRKFIGILVSLSLGGSIFFCTTYMVENLKIHVQMSMKSDDGLGSEYRISEKSDSLADTIPENVAERIKAMPELAKVYATKYTLGEVTIRHEELKWKEYFDERNQDRDFIQDYGGICVEHENGDYGIKYDVYGYEPEMLEELNAFVLEGEISQADIEADNKVIVVANMDGQGNYDFYGKHPGDMISLKVPKSLQCEKEILRFQSSLENYVEKDFEIAAIVSRPLAREEYFLNRNGWEQVSQGIIMTNRQMEKNYGIRDYSIINASKREGADGEMVSARLLKELQNVPWAALQDYTMAIETQQNYLRQQQLFFSGIGAVLLLISLFHIMNSMNYSILARRREFGIMRAMGITDSRFYRMILKEGLLYGVCADILLFLLFHGVFRTFMDYYMRHVIQFLHISAGVPVGVFLLVFILNILIALIAVYVPARKIVKSNIIDEISRS